MPPIIHISSGMIDDIINERNTTFVTVTYTDRTNNRRTEQTVRLIVNNSTIILNENGNPVPANRLQIGMTVDATISSAMTRSIPLQASAFLIKTTL